MVLRGDSFLNTSPSQAIFSEYPRDVSCFIRSYRTFIIGLFPAIEEYTRMTTLSVSGLSFRENPSCPSAFEITFCSGEFRLSFTSDQPAAVDTKKSIVAYITECLLFISSSWSDEFDAEYYD
jgi:hypothetical protein